MTSQRPPSTTPSVAFREGVVLYSSPGALPEGQLNNLVTKIREIDMGDVKAQIAAQAQAQDSE